MERPTFVYVLAREDRILTIEFYHALAKRIKALGITRQGGAKFLKERLYGLKSPVYEPRGIPFVLKMDVIETAYDGSLDFSWHTQVKRFAYEEPQRAPNRSLLLRLQLWDLALKVDGDALRF